MASMAPDSSKLPAEYFWERDYAVYLLQQLLVNYDQYQGHLPEFKGHKTLLDIQKACARAGHQCVRKHHCPFKIATSQGEVHEVVFAAAMYQAMRDCIVRTCEVKPTECCPFGVANMEPAKQSIHTLIYRFAAIAPFALRSRMNRPEPALFVDHVLGPYVMPRRTDEHRIATCPICRELVLQQIKQN